MSDPSRPSTGKQEDTSRLPVEEESGRRRGRRQRGEVSGREMLLKTALSCFARHGYDAASLRDIAQQAGVDVALCARLFGNKQALWQAVIDDMAQDFEQNRRQVVDDMVSLSASDPARAIREFIVFYAELCTDRPAFTAFFLQEATESAPRMNIIQQQLIIPLMRPAATIVKRARDAGFVHCLEPAVFLRMLASAISLTLVAPSLLPKNAFNIKELKQHIVAEASMIFLRTPTPQVAE